MTTRGFLFMMRANNERLLRGAPYRTKAIHVGDVQLSTTNRNLHEVATGVVDGTRDAADVAVATDIFQGVDGAFTALSLYLTFIFNFSLFLIIATPVAHYTPRQLHYFFNFSQFLLLAFIAVVVQRRSKARVRLENRIFRVLSHFLTSTYL